MAGGHETANSNLTLGEAVKRERAAGASPEPSARNPDWWLAAMQMAAHRVDVMFQQGYYQRDTPKHKYINESEIEGGTRRWAEIFYDQIADGVRTPR